MDSPAVFVGRDPLRSLEDAGEIEERAMTAFCQSFVVEGDMK